VWSAHRRQQNAQSVKEFVDLAWDETTTPRAVRKRIVNLRQMEEADFER
jgi:hypothetical protein